MIEFNQKNIGLLLVGISIVLIFLLILVKVNFDKQAVFMCEVVSEDPDLSMEDCPAHQSSTPWLILVAFGAAVLILGSGVYMAFISTTFISTSTKEAQEFRKTDLSKLDEEERNIYGILKQSEGSMYQSDLIKETGFTKVKVTRILDKMENKGVIDRKRRGMANIVVLK